MTRPSGLTPSRARLDVALTQLGLVATRSRARDLITRGLVQIDGQPQLKAGALVAGGAAVTITGDAAADVSRGATKLRAALEHFQVPVAGRVALDLGASTGGFTEALLQAGARHVYAVDVGHAQLHRRLRDNSAVTVLEGQDVRTLDRTLIPEPPGLIVADLSFISLTKALAAPLALAAADAWLVALIKPQFELGRAAIGKGGVVRASVRAEDAVDAVTVWLAAQPGGWRRLGSMASPITGGSGNREFLLAARREGS